MNSRHPDPRRVWQGGRELQSMTPLPGNPLMNSKFCKVAAIYNARAVARRSRFDFLRDLSAITLSFSIKFDLRDLRMNSRSADFSDFYDARALARRPRAMCS